MDILKTIMTINLTLISTDENKGILKKYEEIWIKIKNPIRLRSNNIEKNDIVEKI